MTTGKKIKGYKGFDSELESFAKALGASQIIHLSEEDVEFPFGLLTLPQRISQNKNYRHKEPRK